MRTNVYIDGFNLYYGALRRTPYGWLNVAELCRLLLPSDSIHRIKYFTARVKALPRDPHQPVRQQIYLRALATVPNIEVLYGQFTSHIVNMPRADGAGVVAVVKAEEKGSDVALATHVVHDAHRGDCDVAVVISNDSDLVPPLQIVRQALGMRVGLISSYPHPCKELRDTADFVKTIRERALRASQFPDILEDATGTFHKPESW